MCKLQYFCCIPLERASVLIGYFEAVYSILGFVVSLFLLKFPTFIEQHFYHKAFHGIGKYEMKIFLLIVVVTVLLLSISQFMSSMLLISAVKKIRFSKTLRRLSRAMYIRSDEQLLLPWLIVTVTKVAITILLMFAFLVLVLLGTPNVAEAVSIFVGMCVYTGLTVYTWLAIFSMYTYMKEGETQPLISPGRVIGY